MANETARLPAGLDVAADAPALLCKLPAPVTTHHELEGRLRGMLLRLAIGDALGNTSEGMNPAARHAQLGRVRTYLPNRNAAHRPVGLPSDDTQLAAWTLEHYLTIGHLDPALLSDTFAARRLFGVGSATQNFQAARRRGVRWTRAGQKSAGNGVLMRIAAALPAHLPTGGAGLRVDVALNAFITHNDRLAIASAVAFADILWRLLAGERPDGPEWWLDRYLELGRPLEGDSTYTARVPSGPLYSWLGQGWKMVEEVVRPAVRSGKSVLAAQDEWHSGAFLLETLPTVLMILACHGDDPRTAIEVAVNDTRDNDTIAAIVGSAVGALHGEAALPLEWREGFLGRTDVDDDGAYHALINSAAVCWVNAVPQPGTMQLKRSHRLESDWW